MAEKERYDVKKYHIGLHIKTTEEYNNKLYEPLYHEKIYDGVVLGVSNDGIITYKVIESSCDFNRIFNYHMNKWKPGSIRSISCHWVELVG